MPTSSRCCGLHSINCASVGAGSISALWRAVTDRPYNTPTTSRRACRDRRPRRSAKASPYGRGGKTAGFDGEGGCTKPSQSSFDDSSPRGGAKLVGDSPASSRCCCLHSINCASVGQGLAPAAVAVSTALIVHS